MKFLLVVLIFFMLNNFNINIFDISLEDDSFHSELPLHIETWYFEAIFESNESIVFMITFLSNGNDGIFMTGVHFYENGEIVYEKRKIHNSFFVSDEIPYIVAEGEEIVSGFLEKGKICYNISFSTDLFSFSLFYENTTKGWKTSNNEWLAIPNMKVKGKFKFKNEEKNVTGKGYHDHNIFFLSNPFTRRGYMDGKIMAENLSIVWAKLMKNFFTQENFLIFSEKKYNLIENANIKCFDYEMRNGRFIPTSFIISASYENLSINLTLHTISTHFIRLPLIHYWRYHIHAIGEIKKKGNKVRIDTFDIMEYMLFT